MRELEDYYQSDIAPHLIIRVHLGEDCVLIHRQIARTHTLYTIWVDSYNGHDSLSTANVAVSCKIDNKV